MLPLLLVSTTANQQQMLMQLTQVQHPLPVDTMANQISQPIPLHLTFQYPLHLLTLHLQLLLLIESTTFTSLRVR